jgi:hypothetical protein
MAKQVAMRLMEEVRESSSDHAVVGDCHLANTAIEEDTGRPTHPMQVIARAYGLGDDEEAN